jgi:FkbM family methyltransferase
VRFAKWQISSRIATGSVAHEWINGARFLAKSGDTGLTGNIYTGLHEFHDMAFLLHALRPGDLFIDAGANLGSYTILACAVAGAQGHCFEPVPGTCHRLLENIRLNQLDARVSVHNAALGKSAGTLSFSSNLDTMNHVLTDAEQNRSGIQINVTTLDEAVAINSPTLLKIDVEGYETPVLQGAERLLSNPLLHSVIMELNGSGAHYGFDEVALLQKMADFGFESFAYEPFSRKLVSLKGKNAVSGNTLFIRDLGFITERLATAPQYRIHGVDL